MSKQQNQIPVLQIVGYKNSGKTTLITKVVRHLVHGYGLRILTVKHDHGHFDMDREGTDTWAHRQAGAQSILIQSPHGIGLTMAHDQEKSLDQLLRLVQHAGDYDLALVEGFKQADFPKLVLIRHEKDLPLLEQLSNIKWAVFWQEADRQHYVHQCDRRGIAPFPTGLLVETDKLLTWVETIVL
ncbi:molybdopterin-guanine dinucleotide biosynthesis protein B [Caldalkalibacillus uzonensis]|uniref:Molybdopterin-guanine dinucleotide biosynthesis protein B n=1 Tax=Caldalkalibacillus uzonensis TaxID=353224 RepID=A0ABU0CSR7_9BACI|nr:molybdopterin-guanine dinucleotide biosynthesis protein B [Caldalkalibacillus uzonensis]MDQ0338941.1 molybdopterin-guanine dinucleotide biosynthesis protein B [Caldalkalibacillus uzonensis]